MSGAGSGGQASRVETRFLSMTLDIDSGGLDGEVREGAHAGQQLSELTVKELIALLRTYQAQDRQSAQVLRAYLDRTHPAWRVDETAEWSKDDAAGEAADGSSGEMTRDQALRILGLQQGASETDIRAAHQRLIAVLHPDRGGSSFLAAQVNRARDILTKG
jgi:hypothetical protein